MNDTRRLWVALAALIALVGVAIHVGAVLFAPSWFEFFNAPPSVVKSAREGSWLAPVSGLLIAGAMGICAAYALSALGLIRRLPLQRLGLAVMATVCVVRALLLPILAVGHPELRNTFEVVAAIVWLLAGIGFALGVPLTGATPKRAPR